MTISTTTSVVTYLGNGATTVFSFPFVGAGAADIEVIYTSPQGAQTVLPTSLYTLTLNSVPVGGLWGIGGSVTYPNTGTPPVPIAVGSSLSIVRIVPFTQNISISNQGAFYPQAVEQGLDLLELQIQQLWTQQGFSIQTPTSDPNPPNVLPGYVQRANGYLSFDSNGQPIVTTGPTVTIVGSSATPRRISTSGTTSINILTADSFGGVSIYQSGASATSLVLPATAGPFPVFDGSLNANTYPITVLPPSGKTILGKASFKLSFSGQSAVFYNDGTEIVIG